MFRTALCLSLVACAAAGREDRFGDAGAGDDAAEHGPMDAPAHGSGSGSGSGSSSGGCAFTGALVSWDLTGQAGNEASASAAAIHAGITADVLTRSAGLTVQTGAGSINSSAWPTTATLDATKYYTLAFTAPTGCSVTLTTVAIDLKSSGTGPASVSLATSADNFVAMTALTTNAATTPTVTATTAGTLELRVYGYAATAAGGTLRIQSSLVINGTIQ